MLELTLRAEGLPENCTVYHRQAARGVAVRDGKLLAVRTGVGDYKFPGGGVEPGESLEEALGREMLEETGYQIAGDVELLAVCHERRKGRTADILEMDSYYFRCDVGDTQAPLQLDGYEAEEHFTPVWVDFQEALRANRELAVRGYQPWLDREIAVMEALLGK